MGKVRRRKRAKRYPFPLRDILQRKGITQYRAAQQTGLTEQYISALCCGRKKPSWDRILHILTSLECDLGDLAPKGGAA